MMTEKLIATATRAASLLIVLTALGAGTLPAVAQKTSTVSNEPAGGVLTADGQSVENYCFYSAPREPQTAAPRGYRPFSIQHFGRYGSKYIGVYTGFDAVIKQLKEADRRRLLTDTGRRVKNELDAVLHAAEGRFGDLSPQGFVEQHDIAERMFHNFPEVFADTARVSASSFIISRDALSMGAAVHKLVCLNPSLRFTVRAKLRDAKLLEPYEKHVRELEVPDDVQQLFMHYSQSRCRNARLMEMLFGDSLTAAEADDSLLTYFITKAALIQHHSMPERTFRLVSLLTAADIHNFWELSNVHMYLTLSCSPLNTMRQPLRKPEPLLAIIAAADSAISSGERGASLRFSNEQTLLQLLCMMGAGGFQLATKDISSLQHDGWWCPPVVAAASNMQLVFYRKKKRRADILVKLLVNERETTLPIASDCAPYYRWTDVRRYWLSVAGQSKP